MFYHALFCLYPQPLFQNLNTQNQKLSIVIQPKTYTFIPHAVKPRPSGRGGYQRFIIFYLIHSLNQPTHPNTYMNQTIELTIRNPQGLHARPAAAIARIAQSAKGVLWIRRENNEVDASSIIDILTLACEQGSCISLYAENPHDSPLLDSIAKLVESGFGE